MEAGKVYEIDEWVFLVLEEGESNFTVLCLTEFEHLFEPGQVGHIGKGSQVHEHAEELA